MSKDNNVNEISCYLTKEVIDAHRDDIIYINHKIMEGLKDNNIKDIDFCDVSAGSIQVRLFHKDIPGYACDSVDLSYEWDNIEEVIENAITAFKNFDNPKRVNGFKEFIADGEKWGWD